MFTEPSFHNKKNRFKLTEAMFESANIPAMFINKSGPLSAISCAWSTAMIVDSGHNYTYFVPVHEGYVLDKTMARFPVAGRMISEVIDMYLLTEWGINVCPDYEI